MHYAHAAAGISKTLRLCLEPGQVRQPAEIVRELSRYLESRGVNIGNQGHQAAFDEAAGELLDDFLENRQQWSGEAQLRRLRDDQLFGRKMVGLLKVLGFRFDGEADE
jgi:hypothetical protein